MAEHWGIWGSSASMRRLREEIRILAPLDATVLVTGETGTGKGLVARALHTASERSKQPFVQVDCGALAPSVIESELFGHERGAFTGAYRTQVGRLESAADGTLFLDEIGEIDVSLQAKLLRVLQDRVFERVGATKPRPFVARVVAATHRDLDRAVEQGAFRADLFYRLNVVRLEVPPLRERLEDLPELVAGRGGSALDADSLRQLRHHTWPGNVRELHNHLERRAVEARLQERGLGVRERAPQWAPCGPDVALLATTLREVGGNVSRAARRLGVSRSALRRRIAREGLAAMIPRD